MNDWYNDPPEYDEPPEWYMEIEEALEFKPPKDIADALKKLLDDFNKKHNQQYEILQEP